MRIELCGRILSFFFLALALFALLWSPAAAAKIIVEPGPAELPTDVTYIDDEFFMPLWSYPPMELLTILLLIHCPLLAMPVELVYSAGVMAYLGYRTSRSPLDNTNRHRIYACIRDHPGIAPAEIARATGINRGTVHYHLSCLQDAGLVSILRRKGRAGYFRNGDCNPTEKAMYLHLNNDIRRQILALLLEKPGITQSEIADIMGIARSTAAWYLQKLAADELVESDRDGRTVHYALTCEVLAFSGALSSWGTLFLPGDKTSAGNCADSLPQ